MAGNAPRRPTPSGDLSARARVLVVEDDAFTRTTVCGALQNAGIRVAASSGSAAEALELAAEHRPHAAVVDLDLGPGRPASTSRRASGATCRRSGWWCSPHTQTPV